MKVTLSEHECIVEREPGDRVPTAGGWGTAESRLWAWITKALRVQGHDVIKRRMSADGHMYGDDQLPYVRERKHAFYVYDGAYAVRDIVKAFKEGRVKLLVSRNVNTSSPPRVSDDEIQSMRDEAQKQLAQSGHSDVYIANYDYPATVPSRVLLAVLNELVWHRSK